MVMPHSSRVHAYMGRIPSCEAQCDRIVDSVLRTSGTDIPITDGEVRSSIRFLLDSAGTSSSSSSTAMADEGGGVVHHVPAEKNEPGSAEYERRLNAVIAEQHRLGMAPRSDSRLTVQYAHGSCDPVYTTAAVVAQELVLVDFVFHETLYGEIVEDVMRAVAHRLKRQYRRTSWHDVWDVTRFYVPAMLKAYCLLRTPHGKLF